MTTSTEHRIRTAHDRHRHDWIQPVDVVGGSKDNPGCYGANGGVTDTFVCARCGASRVDYTCTSGYGSDSRKITKGRFTEKLREHYLREMVEYVHQNGFECGGYFVSVWDEGRIIHYEPDDRGLYGPMATKASNLPDLNNGWEWRPRQDRYGYDLVCIYR